jgi:amino acid transporter
MLSIVARLTTYIGTAAAVPILRRRMQAPSGSFRLPGGAIIPALAILLSLAFLFSASWQNLVAGAIALVVGWFIYRNRRANPEM